MQSVQIKHIIFDLDNTLWDFSGNSKRILSEIFEQFRITDRWPIDFDSFHKQYQFRNEYLWKEYAFGHVAREEVRFNRFYITLNDFGINDYKLASDAADYYIHHTKNQKELLPHALETLTYLKSKYDLHIITNGFEEVQFYKLKNSGIDSFFKTVTTAEAAQALKPDKRIFEFALEKIQAPPSHCLYVGDSAEVDGKGATNAGMEFIWLDQNSVKNEYGYRSVASLIELMNIL